MKKFISIILVAPIFMAQNLFAQNVPVSEPMDMKVYTKWMMACVFVLITIIFAVLLFSASKEQVLETNTGVQIEDAFILNPFNVSSGNSAYVLAILDKELQTMKLMLIAALLIFLTILFLIII